MSCNSGNLIMHFSGPFFNDELATTYAVRGLTTKPTRQMHFGSIGFYSEISVRVSLKATFSRENVPILNSVSARSRSFT